MTIYNTKGKNICSSGYRKKKMFEKPKLKKKSSTIKNKTKQKTPIKLE